MKFEVLYMEHPKLQRLALCDSLEDACHAAWALRAMRLDRCTGNVFVWSMKKARRADCLGALDCVSGLERTPPTCPTAAAFFEKCRSELKRYTLLERQLTARYAWLRAKTGDFYVRALGAMNRESPLYIDGMAEAFRRDDFATTEELLKQHGLLDTEERGAA